MSFAHPYLALRDLTRETAPNRWDVVAFALVFGGLVLIVLGAHNMGAQLHTLPDQVSLDPWHLPWYALCTSLRMLAAMLLSLVFSIGYAYVAAKSTRAERVLIPALDILQSVPILGFLSFTVTFFLGLFPGREIGAELASIFVIFTCQAWNMTFSIYQSQRMLPEDLVEVSRSLRLSGWQRFWKLEMPFAMPGLVWNMMMSMSGGWFFIVASEAITVGSHTVTLPGIGSYVAAAIAQRDLHAIGWAIGAMLVVILIYDQLLFRPLVAWSERFRGDGEPLEIETESWVLKTVQRSQWPKAVFGALRELPRANRTRQPSAARRQIRVWLPRLTLPGWLFDLCWYGTILVAGVAGAWQVYHYIGNALPFSEVIHAFELGFLTLLRVLVLVAVASLVWVPVGVAIGLRPRVAVVAQPIAQFLAAFPANLFFPVAVALPVTARPARRCPQSAPARPPVVDQGDPAGDPAVLRHRRDDCRRWRLERQHRCRVRRLGPHPSAGQRPGRLYPASHPGRRLSSYCARRGGDGLVRRYPQPHTVATAVPARRRPRRPGTGLG